MKRSGKMMMLLVLAVCLALVNYPAPAESKNVELKLWSAWPAQNDPAKPALQMLQDMINDKGKSAGVSVKYVGGPEIFGPMQGAESVQQGTVDLAYTAAAYTSSVIPEVDAMKLLETKPWDERTGGIFDLFNKWHNEKGLVYLARGGSGQQFQGYLNKEVRKPDLQGLTMRIVPIYIPLINALGAKGVSTAGGEVYTALERGIVDGFWWGGREIRPWGWHEVVKYIWGPPIWNVDVYVFMNQKSWDGLDDAQKKLLTEIMGEFERKSHDAQVALQSEITQTLLDSGMQIIEFSPEDTKWYLDMARTEGWKEAIKKSGRVQQLKDLMEKK
jgi:TRAP-type C4-dicarboxylate transport system substrate-binding protein